MSDSTVLLSIYGLLWLFSIIILYKLKFHFLIHFFTIIVKFHYKHSSIG